MRLFFTACASLILGLGAGCSGDHTGIPASPPFDPIGTEPASGGSDGGTDNGLIGLLCKQSCANIDRACPEFDTGDYCPRSCASNAQYYARCAAQYVSFLLCQATTQPLCNPFGGVLTPDCDDDIQALNMCVSIGPPPGT